MALCCFHSLTLHFSYIPLLEIKAVANRKNTSTEFRHSTALTERLNIIRYVYGICATVEMTSKQLESLWKICVAPEDREAIMMFLANASNNETTTTTYGPTMSSDNTSNQSHQPLTSSYSNDVQLYAFQTLLCGSSVDWEKLGLKAYKSFQILFKTLRSLNKSFASVQGPALDTLWRICLHAGNDDVASQAMKDLLSLYSLMSATRREKEAASKNAWAKKSVEEIPDKVESFADKIYACLEKVREGLSNGNKLSERSAKRCMRILNAAIIHTGGDGKGNSSSTIHFKPSTIKGQVQNVKDVVQKFPHGLRGQACYRTISVLAKRTSSGQRSPIERFLLQVHPLESLMSINNKVARRCNHDPRLVKPISFNNNRSNLNIEPESSIVDDLGIIEGSEVVFILCSNALPQNQATKNGRQSKYISGLNMADIFGGSGQGPSDKFFETLLDVLEVLPMANQDGSSDNIETQTLVWDILQSVPSNEGMVEKVRSVAQCFLTSSNDGEALEESKSDNNMVIDVQRNDSEWNQLLDLAHYQKAVYVLEVVDSFLVPSTELMEQVDKRRKLASAIVNDAVSFRQAFIDSGGFDAVIRFFNRPRTLDGNGGNAFSRENDYILRIIKCCLFGRENTITFENDKTIHQSSMDNVGIPLLKFLNKSKAFYTNLSGAIVLDKGVSANMVMNALFILQSLFTSDHGSASVLLSVPFDLAEKLTILLLTWENNSSLNAVTIGTGRYIRKTTEELILSTSVLSAHSLPWFIKALNAIDHKADASGEYFSLLIRLVELDKEAKEDRIKIPQYHLSSLSTTLCKKLAQYPRPDVSSVDCSTGVLCGCLKLLRALIHTGAVSILTEGVDCLVGTFGKSSWTNVDSLQYENASDSTILNLMGVIFDAFLSDDNTTSEIAFCSDEKSRRIGFDVLIACANSCLGGEGYAALSSRIRNTISSSSPYLRHRWGQHITSDDIGTLNASANTSQYSGLRNQGCTCYMNSVLQQLFMMPELRKSLCSATLPSILRSSGGAVTTKGMDLVGNCLSMYWENGSSYDAIVEAYDKRTDMHRIRYILPKSSSVPEHRLQNVQNEFSDLHDEFPDEFILAEGRPGKETGVFDIIHQDKNDRSENSTSVSPMSSDLKESEDEVLYRRLLEEVQRTFVHLDKGSRGRVFDPRSLVEASGCLKLEFDIWQQNDASEFAMKLLDKLEVPLKRWSPDHFKYLEHTFGLKQTKQKLCKECGLKVCSANIVII